MEHLKYCSTIILYLILILHIQFSLQSSDNKSNVCDTPACHRAAKNLKDSIDLKKQPCTDFYKYACGNWPKKYKNQDFLVANSTLQIRNGNNEKELLEYLKKKNTDDEPKAVHKARKLFSMCLSIESYYKGVEPVKDILSQCGLSKDPPFKSKVKINLPEVLAKVYRIAGISVLFYLGPVSNPYDEFHNILVFTQPLRGDEAALPLTKKLKEKTTSSGKSDDSQKIMERFCENVSSKNCEILKQGVWSKLYPKFDEYQSELKQTLNGGYDSGFEKISLAELQNMTNELVDNVNSVIPTFNWTLYLSTLYENISEVSLDFSKPENIHIATADIELVKNVIVFLQTNAIQLHETMLWLSVVTELGTYADKEIARITGSDLIPKKTRTNTCIDFTSQVLGMAVSYYYATNLQYTQTKDEITTLVYDIVNVLNELIQNSTWMDNKTMRKALKKVKAMSAFVAYPSSLETPDRLDEFYENIVITDSFIETLLTKARSQIKKTLATLDKVNDLREDRREVTPTTVNAFYDPERNAIVIPAGILGVPIYDLSLRALSYGAIGFVVGHEITHGFDNTGSQYNALGNLEEWWQSKTLTKYKNKAKCFANAYKNYSITFQGITMQGDSDLTLGEDIADNGGFKEALFAYRQYVRVHGEEPLLPSFENYTHEQLFTLAFANVWCENPTSLSSITASYSEHSPNGIRVDGVLKNSEEFAKIWNCPEGSKMNPKEKCVLW